MKKKITANEAPTWFTVDKEGLAALRENMDPAALIHELAQNAWDEPITKVSIDLTPHARGLWVLTAADDAPDGFRDLSHAFTLFAPSYKKADAEKRGRFNVGEKMVLALAESATIRTTTGEVRFAKDGTRTVTDEVCTSTGTVFTANVRLTAEQARKAIEGARLMLAPADKATYINGVRLDSRAPIRVLKASALPTVIESPPGHFGVTPRNTTIEVYEPAPGEEAMIYEMGIPVVATGDRWHANVMQKVPLNIDRDNVTPAYLRRIRQELLEGMIEQVTGDEAAKTWVREAVTATDDPQVVAAVIRERYGDKVVAYDPSDQEGSKRAVAEGYAVVYSRSLSQGEWAAVGRASAALGAPLIAPAGQVTPSNSTIELSPDGKPPIPTADWTPGMKRVARYAEAVASAMLGGMDVTVLITNQATGGYDAAFGNRTLRLNVGCLGHRWFDAPDEGEVLALLIHEYAHWGASDHLSHTYHEFGFTLGAKATMLALTGRMPRL